MKVVRLDNLIGEKRHGSVKAAIRQVAHSASGGLEMVSLRTGGYRHRIHRPAMTDIQNVSVGTSKILPCEAVPSFNVANEFDVSGAKLFARSLDVIDLERDYG